MKRKRSRKRAPTLPALKRKAWKLLSEYVRRSQADRDGRVICYTCGRSMRWQDSQAGHFVPGRTASVLLDERVIRIQDVRCNVLLGGNYQVFTLRMIDELGREKVEELLALKHKVVKWNRADLDQFIETYQTKLRDLEVSRTAHLDRAVKGQLEAAYKALAT